MIAIQYWQLRAELLADGRHRRTVRHWTAVNQSRTSNNSWRDT